MALRALEFEEAITSLGEPKVFLSPQAPPGAFSEGVQTRSFNKSGWGTVHTYITADELIPVAHEYGHKHVVSVSLLLGIIFALMVDAILS